MCHCFPHILHCCAQSYGVAVAPGDEASLQYSFTPNKQLHPREFYVALTAFYSSPAGEASRWSQPSPFDLKHLGT